MMEILEYILKRSWRKHLSRHLQLFIDFLKGYLHVGTRLAFVNSLADGVLRLNWVCGGNVVIGIRSHSCPVLYIWVLIKTIDIRKLSVNWCIILWLLLLLLGRRQRGWRRNYISGPWRRILAVCLICGGPIFNCPRSILDIWGYFLDIVWLLLATVLHVYIVEDSLWRLIWWLPIAGIQVSKFLW